MKRSRFSKVLLMLACSAFIFSTAKSQEKQEEKINAATQVLKDFGDMKENIPAELLKITQGIIIVPKLLNGGFVLAAKRGKGVAMVRLPDGSWSNPVFVTITGGSVGLQAGVQSVDLVLIFKHAATLQNIGKGSFTLGGEISATAGPVGRNSTASTDYKMEAEVYSYSRSKGLFAGISLSGSAISVDSKSNESFYGKDLTSGELFSNDTEVDSKPVSALKSTLEELYKDEE
ncbi:MAG TPA: lipid-binding SYLF domain-containing protein [Chitinophagaceae bacterium]|nr:lipid-binding SYLF domain-containing protein [Chitinophagaceae bacterium]